MISQLTNIAIDSENTIIIKQLLAISQLFFYIFANYDAFLSYDSVMANLIRN